MQFLLTIALWEQVRAPQYDDTAVEQQHFGTCLHVAKILTDFKPCATAPNNSHKKEQGVKRNATCKIQKQFGVVGQQFCVCYVCTGFKMTVLYSSVF